MKKAMCYGLALGLLTGVANVPTMVSAQDYRRDDRRDERYDRRDDQRYDRRDQREGGWWDRLTNSRDSRDLEGIWYMEGDRNRRAEVVAGRRGLEAVNEHGQASRLEVGRGGEVRALDWERGLRGELHRDRIEWANGTTWTREPSDRAARRR